MQDFSEHGYHICGVIGLDGSPSCGVHTTCSGQWYGEIGEGYGVLEKAKTLTSKTTPGVMMQVLEQMLREAGLSVPFYSLEETDLETGAQQVLTQIQKRK